MDIGTRLEDFWTMYFRFDVVTPEPAPVLVIQASGLAGPRECTITWSVKRTRECSTTKEYRMYSVMVIGL